MIQANGGWRPYIRLTRASDRPERPLTDSVADWFSPERKTEIAQKFAAIAGEENAGAFSAFIDRLKETRSAEKVPMFKEQVAEWLALLSASPELRKATFAIAQGATASCEDRIALTWNDMQKAELLNRIERGEYDDRWPELVTAGREMFRLERLERIARKKVETLRFVDEIEVYLGFQTRLREPLSLTGIMKEMRFFRVSGITESDLQAAELQVKTAENSQFPVWFALWESWHKVVERKEPKSWVKASEERRLAYENDYDKRVKEELDSVDLPGDAKGDAERTIGVNVQQDMDRKVFGSMTLNVLEKKGQRSLLDEPWKI